MQVQFSLLNYIYRGGFSSSRPCVTANGEQRAPSSFAYALTRTPSLNDIPSRSSFVYSDRVIAYSDDYWFRNKSSNQMPSAAGCSTKVSGDTYAQRLSGSEGDGAYSNEGLSHTDLPTSGAYIPSSRPAVFWLFPGNGYETKGLELCPEQPFLSCSPESHSFRWVGLLESLFYLLKKSFCFLL